MLRCVWERRVWSVLLWALSLSVLAAVPAFASGAGSAVGAGSAAVPVFASGAVPSSKDWTEVERLTREQMASGNYRAVVRTGRSALQSGLECLELHKRMATAYRMLHCYENAASHWKRARQMHPASADILRELYRDLWACGRYDEALAVAPAGWGARSGWDYWMVNVGYSSSGNYDSLVTKVKAPASGSLVGSDSASLYWFRDYAKGSSEGRRIYSEIALQGPGRQWTIGGQYTFVWPSAASSPNRLQVVTTYTDFRTQSKGVVQSQYGIWDTVSLQFKVGDTLHTQDYLNHSWHLGQRWSFVPAGKGDLKASLAFAALREQAGYLSSTLDTYFQVAPKEMPYLHHAGYLGLSLHKRIRSAEWRGGWSYSSLNKGHQKQWDLGFSLWPLGNQALLLGADFSLLEQVGASSSGLWTFRSVWKSGVYRPINEPKPLRRIQQVPGLTMEIRYTGGGNLRNYTLPGTMFSYNSYENIRSILAVSLQLPLSVACLPGKPTGRFGRNLLQGSTFNGLWRIVPSWQIQSRDQEYWALNSDKSETRIKQKNNTQLFNLTLLWSPN